MNEQPSQLLKKIGKLIAAARDAAGFTSNEQLGKAIGYDSPSTVGKYINAKGGLGIEDLYKIAEVCHVRVTDLLPLSETSDDYVRLIDLIDQLPITAIRRVRAYVQQQLDLARQHTSTREHADGYQTTNVTDRAAKVTPLTPAQKRRRREKNSS
jgi:transcriptional regulator with XRE-family HTH domain